MGKECTSWESSVIKIYVGNVGNRQEYSWGRKRKLALGEDDSREG